MRWNCPHCGVNLAVIDDQLSTGWSFSRCYQCGGFALVRQAEINVIKVDRAPQGERVLLPESHETPMLSDEATRNLQKILARKGLNKEANRPAEFALDNGLIASSSSGNNNHFASSGASSSNLASALKASAKSPTTLPGAELSSQRIPLRAAPIPNNNHNEDLIASLLKGADTKSSQFKSQALESAASLISGVSGASGLPIIKPPPFKDQALMAGKKPQGTHGQMGMPTGPRNTQGNTQSSTKATKTIMAINGHTSINGRFPEPLPDAPEESWLRKLLPAAIGLTGILSVSSGIYLFAQMQSFWNKTKDPQNSAKPTRTRPVAARPPTATAAVVSDEVHQNAMAPIRNIMVQARVKNASLYSGPGMQFQVIGVADPKLRYEVTDWNDHWFKIIGEPRDPGTPQAWIRNDMVQRVQ